MHGRNAHPNATAHTKRARISGLFYFALEEGSSQAIHQLPFSSAGRLFLLGFPPGRFLLGLFLGLFLGFLLGLAFGYFLFSLTLGFLLSLLFSLAPGFLLGFLFSLALGLFLGLFLGFLLSLAFGYLLLSLALGLLFRLFLGFLLGLALGDFLLSLFLGFLLHYPPFFLGGLFLFRCAALFRRCFFLRCYFPLLRDLPLRSFFTRLLFGSHAFLRVGYPELSIYNKGKNTSNMAVRTSQEKYKGISSVAILKSRKIILPEKWIVATIKFVTRGARYRAR